MGQYDDYTMARLTENEDISAGWANAGGAGIGQTEDELALAQERERLELAEKERASKLASIEMLLGDLHFAQGHMAGDPEAQARIGGVIKDIENARSALSAAPASQLAGGNTPSNVTDAIKGAKEEVSRDFQQLAMQPVSLLLLADAEKKEEQLRLEEEEDRVSELVEEQEGGLGVVPGLAAIGRRFRQMGVGVDNIVGPAQLAAVLPGTDQRRGRDLTEDMINKNKPS